MYILYKYMLPNLETMIYLFKLSMNTPNISSGKLEINKYGISL